MDRSDFHGRTEELLRKGENNVNMAILSLRRSLKTAFAIPHMMLKSKNRISLSVWLSCSARFTISAPVPPPAVIDLNPFLEQINIEILIIHRFGFLKPGDQIVLVCAASAHRQAAIEACNFLIDWLKTKAPFWKYEEKLSGGEWVTARKLDEIESVKWER